MIFNINCNATIGLFHKQITQNTHKINLIQANNRHIKNIITYRLFFVLFLMILSMVSCYILFINYGCLKLIFLCLQSDNIESGKEGKNNENIKNFYEHLDKNLLQQNYNKQFAIIKFMQQKNIRLQTSNKSLWYRIQLYFEKESWEKYFTRQKQNFDNWLHSSLIDYYHGFIKEQKNFYSYIKPDYIYDEDNSSYIWKLMHFIKVDKLFYDIFHLDIIRYITHYLSACVAMVILIGAMFLIYRSDILLNIDISNHNIEEIYKEQQKIFNEYKENQKQKKIENRLKKMEKRKLLWDEHIKCQKLDIPSPVVIKKILRVYNKYLKYKELQKELQKKHNANRKTSVNYDAEIYQNSHFKPENLK